MRALARSGVAAVLLASILWGTTGTAAAMAPEAGSLAIGAAAMGVGGLLQAGFSVRIVVTHWGQLRSRWVVIALSALAVAVFPLPFYSSVRLSGVAVGTVVTVGSAPPAAALIERLMDRAPLSGRWLAGTARGVAGVLGLVLERSPAGAMTHGTEQPSWAYPVGIGLGLVGGFTYALYSWGVAKVIRHEVPSRAVTGAVFGLGGILLLPVLLVTGGPILASGTSFAVATYLALVPMFLGYLLFGRGLAQVSASTATTLSLAEPAAAALFAIALLDERLAPAGWLGIALLFVSLFVIAPPRHLVADPTAREHDPMPQLSRADAAAWAPE